MKNTFLTLHRAWTLAHDAKLTPSEAPDGVADPGGEAGMATAEYAIGTLAAAAFAGLLLAIMRSGSLTGILQGLIESALSVG
ncbi:DUF4244 domain-containing protein [Actinomyces sp. MRS3W]|uniref:DUF4244 domain-containing protein n=1 Tax=Actinomyces sp. MRS3W TaxID=2800796 RepID=UPI0028FD19CA|nr:DUF4244 domain-containing protein [Actinomyces sp. MRS3W]MDU0348112.1 DUF4244 domain-containing protein [Actinomyces sp. MRS3W]